MKPTGWPPARSGTILRLGEKRARRGCSAYASESDIHKYSINNLQFRLAGLGFRPLNAEFLHAAAQRIDMHPQGLSRTVFTPDPPVLGFQNPQDIIALHFGAKKETGIGPR